MTALALFAATFSMVFLLGLQQLNVSAGHRALAFVTSIGITAATLVLYKLLPGPTDAMQIVAHFLGGATGIVASMWAHPRMVALIRRRLGADATPERSPPEQRVDDLELARRIADQAARGTIEQRCGWLRMGHLDWWDTSACDQPETAEALRYLRLRGAIVTHPTRSEIVRFAEGTHA